MQENNDQKLADQGWHAMCQRLDSEMPEAPGRRKGPFGWWLMMLAVLASGLWASYEMGRVQGRKENLFPVATKMPETAVPAQRPPAQTTEAFLGGQHSDKPQNAGITTWRASAPKINFQTVRGGANVSNSVEHAAESTVMALPGKVLEVINTSTDINLLPIRPKAAISLLPGNMESSVKIGRVPALEETNLAESRSPRWALGVTGQASTESFTNLNGISGGLTVRVRLNKHFGLRSGALYSYYRPNTVSQPLIIVEKPEYAQATKNYYLLNNPDPSEDASVVIPIQKLHRIEVPLVLYWQPAKRWQVFSGASIGYTFSGKSSEENFTDDKVLRLRTTVAERGADRLVTEELHPWQTDFQGGLNYMIYRRLELGLSYKRPFSFQRLNHDKTAAKFDGGNALPSSDKYLHQHLLTLSSTLFF